MRLTASILLFFFMTCSLAGQTINQNEPIDTLSEGIKVYIIEDIIVVDYKAPVGAGCGGGLYVGGSDGLGGFAVGKGHKLNPYSRLDEAFVVFFL